MPAVIHASLDAGDELDMQVQIHTDTLNESGLLRGHDRARSAAARSTPTTPRARAAATRRTSSASRRGQLPAVLDEPDQPVHGQHVRRAPRHGDGLPSPQPPRARGRRVRRVADPPRDDRRRGRAARPRRDQRHRVGLAGHGPHRRDDRAHLAGRVAHEGRARVAARGRRHGQRQPRASSATSPSSRSTPARIYGIDHEIGSLEPGKLADIVLWEPKFFGIKPEVVFKGGFPAWSVMGESNASLMTCEPLTYRPQWGAFGGARQDARR